MLGRKRIVMEIMAYRDTSIRVRPVPKPPHKNNEALWLQKTPQLMTTLYKYNNSEFIYGNINNNTLKQRNISPYQIVSPYSMIDMKNIRNNLTILREIQLNKLDKLKIETTQFKKQLDKAVEFFETELERKYPLRKKYKEEYSKIINAWNTLLKENKSFNQKTSRDQRNERLQKDNERSQSLDQNRGSQR